MKKTHLSALVVAALTLIACDSTLIPTADPLSRTSGIDLGGAYDGSWVLTSIVDTIIVDTTIVDADTIIRLITVPTIRVSTCPGTLTLVDYLNRSTFEGSFLIHPTGCGDGHTVSGEVADGRVRSDGGVAFTMRVPPTRGEEKSEDDIWEDIFVGTGVGEPERFIGCSMGDHDNQMNGAVSGSQIAASASAELTCGGVLFIQDSLVVRETGLQLKVQFDGSR